MKEFKPIDPILFKICITLDPNEFTPDQLKQMQEGTVYTHQGITQFKYGGTIYATRENSIVQNYLESKDFEFAEYGSFPVTNIDHVYVDRKFYELHSKLYGEKPSSEWAISDFKKEETFMRMYRKYAAICSDPNLTKSKAIPFRSLPDDDLRNFIESLEEFDPYFKESLKDFKKTDVGISFTEMLTDRKRIGKEISASHNFDGALRSSQNPAKHLLRLVKDHLTTSKYKLLQDELKTNSYLSAETVSFCKNLLVQKEVDRFIKEESEKNEI